MFYERTAEEGRDLFLDSVRQIARFWGQVKDPEYDVPERRCFGVIHSVLALIDGSNADMPAFDLVVRPHPDDYQYHKDRDEAAWVDGTVINDHDMLHELLYPDPRRESPR